MRKQKGRMEGRPRRCCSRRRLAPPVPAAPATSKEEREQGGFGERAESEWREEKENEEENEGEVGGFVRREGKGMFG